MIFSAAAPIRCPVADWTSDSKTPSDEQRCCPDTTSDVVRGLVVRSLKAKHYEVENNSVGSHDGVGRRLASARTRSCFPHAQSINVRSPVVLGAPGKTYERSRL